MTPKLVPVGPNDSALILGIQARCADYIEFETGMAPGVFHLDEFLADAPPNLPPEQVFLAAITDSTTNTPIGLTAYSHGYPTASDAYIGLLMIPPQARGLGVGRAVLAQITVQMAAKGCTRMLLCVMQDNAKGRAFWARAWFEHRQTTPVATFGNRTHLRAELTRPIPYSAA